MSPARDRARRDHRRDGGQATVLVVGVVAVAAVVTLGLGRLATEVLDGASAQSAADAAALAGATGGRSTAEQVAVANGGALVSFTASGDDVIVVVQVGDRRASARASTTP